MKINLKNFKTRHQQYAVNVYRGWLPAVKDVYMRRTSGVSTHIPW